MKALNRTIETSVIDNTEARTPINSNLAAGTVVDKSSDSLLEAEPLSLDIKEVNEIVTQEYNAQDNSSFIIPPRFIWNVLTRFFIENIQVFTSLNEYENLKT